MANTLAQNVTMVSYGGATTVSATFGSALTNPSLIIAAASQENQAGTFTISDNSNAGNYTQDKTATTSNTAEFGNVVIARKQSTSTAAAVVTCTLSASTTGVLKVYEFTGADTTNAFDSGDASGTDGAAHSLTFTTGTANCSIVTIGAHYPAGATVDTNYTQAFAEHGGSAAYHYGTHRVDAGAAGSVTLTYNLSIRDYWAMAVAAYKTTGAPTNGFLNRNYFWSNY